MSDALKILDLFLFLLTFVTLNFQFNEIFSVADTFSTHAKLHKRGSLPLLIIIPEADLKFPVIDIELDVDMVDKENLVASHTPCEEPSHPESSSCIESLDQTNGDTSSALNEDDIDDDDDTDDNDDADESQKEKQKKKCVDFLEELSHLVAFFYFSLI